MSSRLLSVCVAVVVKMVAFTFGALTLLPALYIIAYIIGYLFGISVVSQLTIRALSNHSDRFWVTKERQAPAVLYDPALGNHSYVQLKNVKIHYVENGDKSKPLMLMVHGYPEFWYSFRYQLKEFAKDYWVVAMDMRGFGDSEKPFGAENYKIDIIAQDIKEVIEALGRKKFTLVGHDWGGIVAWYFVLTYHQYIESYVILNSCHPYVFRKGLETDLAQIQRSWYMFFYNLPYVPELRATVDDMAYLQNTIKTNIVPITAADIEAYKYNFGRPGVFTSGLNIYKANIFFKDSEKLLGRGNSPDFPPGLCLFGDADHVLDLLQVESAKMADNTRLVYIRNATHFVQQDDPVRVNGEMRKFFSEISSS